jgi:tetratricopeptide (TPR) repeat protein
MTAPDPIPARGTLSELPLPRMLLDLYRSRFTGQLELSRARTQKLFTLQEGALVGSESNVPSEQLTAILQDTGAIDRKDRERVNARVQQERCKEGVALLALELLDAKQLFEGLREQVRRRAIECFGWPAGDFTLEQSNVRKDDIQPFRTDPFRLVQDGLQTHWSLERMLDSLGARMTQYAKAGPGLGKIVAHLSLDATVERMIAGLSGKHTLGSVIGSAVTSPAALAAFWVLDSAGALSYSDEPCQSEANDDPVEIEIEITDRQAARASGTDAPKLAIAKPSARKTAKSGAENEKMRQEILDRFEKLGDMDYYQLLGVQRDAALTAIRKAYFLAAKRYHPDAIARLDLKAVRTEAGAVFARIAEANEVLSDPQRREAYDRAPDGDAGKIDVAILGQAETFYRKGEILINMGDFRGALEYLKNAVELYPDEAAYQSDLAWCYYKKTPSEPKPAHEHIQRALELDPSDAVAQFRLGIIERGLDA